MLRRCIPVDLRCLGSLLSSHAHVFNRVARHLKSAPVIEIAAGSTCFVDRVVEECSVVPMNTSPHQLKRHWQSLIKLEYATKFCDGMISAFVCASRQEKLPVELSR